MGANFVAGQLQVVALPDRREMGGAFAAPGKRLDRHRLQTFDPHYFMGEQSAAHDVD